MGTARWKGGAGNRGRPVPGGGRGLDAAEEAAAGRESDRVVVPLKPGNAGGGKGPDFWCAFEAGEDEVIGDEPDNTRKDQDASEEAVSQGEGGARLPLLQLYDKVCREDILRHAYALARANAGAPGVDGVTFGQIEAAGLEEWLAGLREELRSKTYGPQPVRRVMIPKPGGGERPLGIPTIRDRVVQTAARLVLEPIFEADLDASAYGYRPRRSGARAIKEVHWLLCRGYTDVVDADLSKYFDTIPHAELMQSVARRIVDRHVLRLIKLWLKAPVEERDGKGTAHDRWQGQYLRHAARRGDQSVACQHLHEPVPEALADHWPGRGIPGSRRLLCRRLRHSQPRTRGRGSGVDARRDDQAWLALNEAKTSICDARRERFDFLGYAFGPRRYRKDGHWYLGASSSRKRMTRPVASSFVKLP